MERVVRVVGRDRVVDSFDDTDARWGGARLRPTGVVVFATLEPAPTVRRDAPPGIAALLPPPSSPSLPSAGGRPQIAARVTPPVTGTGRGTASARHLLRWLLGR